MTDYTKMKLYIAVHDDVPDNMVPVVVAHAVLNADAAFANHEQIPIWDRWNRWAVHSFKKVVVRVSDAEFREIAALPYVYLGSEDTVMDRAKCVAVVCPRWPDKNEPVLRNAVLWGPKGVW